MTTNATPKRVPGFWEIVRNLDYYIAVVCMLLVTVYCVGNVVFRFFIGKTSAALDELNIIIFIWFLYAAIAYCVRTDKHIRIEILDLYVSKKTSALLKIISDVIWLAFSGYITYAGLQLIQFNLKYVAKTSILEIPVFVTYSIVFLSFLAMTIFLMRNIRVKTGHFLAMLREERTR